KNRCQLVERAVPKDEIRYKVAIRYSVPLRPSLSDGIEPSNAPITVPINAMDTVSPCCKLFSCQYFCIDCSAPEITAVSNPKRKPPNAITSDHRKTFFL